MLSLSSFSLALKIVKEKILLFTFTLYPILSGYYLILTPDVWVLQTSSNPVTPVQCSEMYCVCLFFCVWLNPKTCGILLLRPGVKPEPMPSAVEAQRPNRWIARESPVPCNLIQF